MIYLYAAAVLAVLTVIGVALMAADKSRARRGVYRIPERVLFLASALGCGIGTLIGMYAFRHKTRHKKFVIGLPFCALLSAAIVFFAAWLISSLIN